MPYNLPLVFQKAVKEVAAYVEESVVPEGLTLRPPEPPVDSDEEVTTEKQVSSVATSE